MSILIFSTIVGVALASSVPASAFAESHEVDIVKGSTTLGDKSYSPNPIQVANGDTIVFYNRDTVVHSATSGDSATGVASGEFDTGLLGPNRSAQVVVNGEVDIPYFCIAHPTMVGLVQVSTGPAPSPTEATAQTVYQNQTFTVTSVSAESVKATNLTINPGVSVGVQLSGAGEVELNLPTEMIEGISSVTTADGTDIVFTTQEETSAYTRIKLEAPSGENSSITIMGSRVVPEFPLVLLVLAGPLAAAVIIIGRVYGAKSLAPRL